MTDLPRLLEIAEGAVAIAADLVESRPPGAVHSKGDRDMASDTDIAVEQAVRAHLAKETPQIAFLGEEEGAHPGEGELSWVLDPIDGTVNYLHGVPLWGISLGLVAGTSQRLGVLHFPRLGTRYTAAEGLGAFRNGEAIRVSRCEQLSEALVMAGDFAVGADAAARNRPRTALIDLLVPRVQRIRMLGTAALHLALVADGSLDASIMFSNKPWDTSAGVIIAREAGAIVVDVDGSPHDVASGATIALSPGIAEELLPLI
ncbi:inositol monophosphatase [Kribbella flavida DSM 17836]|uniref:Inositol monophosphatase n=1 Tax=Kribbella flavida (strain DSM 17836 / JCM 10339 / NBRC 14399) TaxID=479435 RepID=D2PY86_KRIFD|nr:inositol monophosphatase family protein [Kribbella flavida]ADB35454.1 inositol monophosphatase [Kribbella flavida DSM 17836]